MLSKYIEKNFEEKTIFSRDFYIGSIYCSL